MTFQMTIIINKTKINIYFITHLKTAKVLV